METGFYKKRPFDWASFEADLFVPHLFYNECGGCGANALALLTGIPPKFIHNTNYQNPNHWKDSFMIKFLKHKGFKIHHVTKCDVSNTVSTLYASDSITERHIFLFSQLMNKNSASWAVAHNNLWYHNFQTCSFIATSLLNRPTLTTYLIIHPSWKRENWVDSFRKKK